MQKFLTVTFLAVLCAANLPAQTGYRNSGNQVLPFVTTLRSNDVFNVGATGSPINPTNKNLRVQKLDEYLVQRTNLVGGILGVPVPGYSMDVPVGANLRSVYRPTPFVMSKLIRRVPITILWIGDSVALETKGSLEASLHQLMPRNGAAFSSTVSQQLGTLYSYMSATGGQWLDNNFEWPQAHHLMANGSIFEWQSGLSNGVTANALELYFVKVPSGGTLNVETQSFGGSWASIATLSGNSGGGLVGGFTNWAFPTVQNMRYRVTSTGTNIVVGGSMWNTNLYSGWRAAQWDISGESLIDFFATTTVSNVTRTYLAGLKPDLVFVTAKETDTILADGINSLETVLADVSPRTDVAYITSAPARDGASAWALTAAMRSMVEIVGATNNRPVIDIFGLLSPTNAPVQAGFSVDGSHLSDNGQTYAGWYLTRFLGLDVGSLAAIGLTNRFGGGAAVDISGKANLSGGNSITGPNNFSEVNATNLTAFGTGAALGLRFRDDQSQQIAFIANGAGLHFADSRASYVDLFAVLNNSGTPEIDVASGFNPPRLFKNYYGEGYFRTVEVTNLNIKGPVSSPLNLLGDVFANNVNATNFAVWGSGAAVGLRFRDDQSQQIALIASGQGLHFADSRASYVDLFAVLNNSGTPEIDVNSGFNRPKLFPNYRGRAYLETLYATNFNLNLPTGVTPGNTTTPVAWGQVTNNAVRYFVPLYQ